MKHFHYGDQQICPDWLQIVSCMTLCQPRTKDGKHAIVDIAMHQTHIVGMTWRQSLGEDYPQG